MTSVQIKAIGTSVATNDCIDIDNVGPTEIRYSIAWTNQQMICVYLFYSMVSVSRNIVRYNKYLLAITAVVVFVSYYYSYCDFVGTLNDHYWFAQVQVVVPVLYAFYF